MAIRRQRTHGPRSCLSSVPHDDNIFDEYLHYSGCLKISEREQYFDALSTNSQQYIRSEIERTGQLRAILETLPIPTKPYQLRQFIDEYRRCVGVPLPIETDYVDDTTEPQHVDADSLAQVPVLSFKDGKPRDIPGLENCFPNQKVSVRELLTGNSAATNPLLQHDQDAIRYFHLPANNMDWVERAITKYYGERPYESHGYDTPPRTDTILKSEFWQVQRCFDSSSEVHARHMKSFCDTIQNEDGCPRNMVLFMPYLHWETDLGRSRTAEKIQQVNKERLIEEEMERASIEMADVVMSHQRQLHPCPTPLSAHTITHASNEERETCDNLSTLDLKTKAGRRRLIGLILLKAAEVFEAMDFITEECLITEYLHKSPPLHPRRTLDQFYYSSLRSTQARDRDQVVYRATCLAPPHQNCFVNVYRRKCYTCQRESQKVPRLVMVDQLWLWILDDKTIITSFPRRWGRIRPDSSDVHEAIRKRLKGAGSSDIKSAYDIALVVIDECSRVFFDRTLDRRPKLIDIFADAISCITYKQAAAFDRFLIYAQIVSRETKGGLWHDAATQHVLLNINSECNMLKQAMDIIDELQIMIRIIEEQRMVVSRFIGQVEGSRLSTASSGVTSMVLTLGRARRLQVSIEGRLNELMMLLKLARKTSDALKDLLTIKQQQASAIEAREAVRNGDEVYMQGKSIMLLTVTTIIFLPLSFMSSLFGMNVVELDSGALTFSEEFKYMFPIATGVVVVSFFLAFNHSIFTNALAKFIRAVASFFYNTTLTWLAVRTGWYLLESNVTRKTNSLRNREIGITGGMRAEALRNEKNIRQMRASQELIKHMGREHTISRRSTFSNTEYSVLEERVHPRGDVELGYR
ncbi:hypothetical protein F4805DRAFT_460944 [Annulohypoxylon moriforme]|nr:hypothetical protein F4805DRAFT_460944 [Annulohypoxylon moriforme]